MIDRSSIASGRQNTASDPERHRGESDHKPSSYARKPMRRTLRRASDHSNERDGFCAELVTIERDYAVKLDPSLR